MRLYDVSDRVFRLKASGKKVIEFHVGDPDQSTDPRIKTSLLRSLTEGNETKYSSASGIISLRKKLAENHGTKPENIFVSTGSKIAIFYAMNALLTKGDNVLIPSPHWPAYAEIAGTLGAEPRFVTSEGPDWGIDPNRMADAVDKRTKLIVICNPSNPTSKTLEPEVLESIAGIGKDNNITILSDECYSDIAFNRPVVSIADRAPAGTPIIRFGSFSKTFAMTGLRVGYAIADEGTVREFTRLAQLTTTNVPVPIQRAAETALGLKEEISLKTSMIYKKRAAMAMGMLGGTNLRIPEPDAPFYLFPEILSAGNSDELASRLLGNGDVGVAIAPGTAFGASGKHFRLALTLPEGEMAQGLEAIAKELRR